MFTIGALSQYKMFIIFEGICSIEKLYNTFIPTDARQASVIAGARCFGVSQGRLIIVSFDTLSYIDSSLSLRSAIWPSIVESQNQAHTSCELLTLAELVVQTRY